MATATTRILRLLTLLQARRDWSGSELAERLEIDVRTVRRDVDRLRELGYVIESAGGIGGGYRMSAGTTTPPLLLDDDEVSAVAIALSSAASGIANLRETVLGVLLKLDRVMPARLRPKLSALEAATLHLPGHGREVDWKMLTTLAGACRDRLELHFEYRDREKKPSVREVEPLRIVHTGRLWYLVAWDRSREDFRTFRVDRIFPGKLRTGATFVPRELPEDVASYVARSLASVPHRYKITLELEGSLESLAEFIPSWAGVLEDAPTPGHALLTLGSNSLEGLLASLVHLGRPILRIEPEDIAKELSALAEKTASSLDRALTGRQAH
jgi:predicted DNA-binding transcriptional regulator YafY